MVILGTDLGANVQLVAVMHVARQVILMLLVPVLTKVATGRKELVGAREGSWELENLQE